MMCQEVIELMQRYLDRDLGETEYRRMLQHLQQCPDCTELFERLVKLSNELENLPKVTPPFSLVDAIMPKLEMLEATGGAHDAVFPAGQADADNDLRAAAAETPRDVAAERKASGGWRKNARQWISFPVFGGVVAAGLVVGFFLFGQQSQSDSDAGKLMLSLSTANKSESAADHKAAAPKNSGSGQQPAAAGSSSNAANAGAAGNAKSPSDGSVSPAPAADSNSAPKAEAPTASPDTPRDNNALKASPGTSTDNNAQKAPATEPKRTVEAGGAAPQQPQPTPAPGSDTAKPAAAAESAPHSAGANEPMSTFMAPAPAPGQTQDTASTAPAAGSGDKSSAERQPAEVAGPKLDNRAKGSTGSGQQMGIAAFPAPTPAPVTELTTADGVYKAVIQDDKVTVFDKQGKAVYSSKYDWKDGSFKLELVEWSAEYKLTYRVKASDQVRTFIIAMKDLTESESKP